MSATPPTPPTPPPDGAVPPPSATSGTVRRSGDRVVAGVAAGLGRRYGVDPVLVRILFAVTTFAAGLGALVYLVLWVALPLVQAPAPPQAARAGARGPAFWLGAIAITVGAVIALSELPAPRIFVPLALITLGVALWQRPGGSGTAPGQPGVASAGPPPSSPSSSSGVPASWQPPPVPGDRGGGAAHGAAAPVAWAGTSGGGTATLERPPAPTDESTNEATAPPSGWEPVPEMRWWIPPQPRQRPSWLGPITIAVALVVTGVVALLGLSGALAPTGADLVAVAVLVLAGGMVVGAFLGRAKWLALPALALTGIMVLAQGVAGLGIVLSPTAGTSVVEPVDLAEPTSARLGFGELIVDLTETDLDGAQPMEVDVVFGLVQVVVPADARVELRANVGAGEVSAITDARLDDEGFLQVDRQQFAGGTRLDVVETLEPAGPVGDSIVLDVAVGAGEVEVYRGTEAFELGRTSTGEDFGFDSLGTGEGGPGSMEFDVGEGGSATGDEGSGIVDDGFLGYVDASTWFYAEECPAGDLDDDLLAICLDRLAPSIPALSGDGHSLREQLYLEECVTERIVDDPDALLEPCLRLVVSPDEPTSATPEGER